MMYNLTIINQLKVMKRKRNKNGIPHQEIECYCRPSKLQPRSSKGEVISLTQ